jgi:GNAT superfamily N-acetyltransferase
MNTAATTTAATAAVTAVGYAAVGESDFDALADLRIEAMRESLERVGRFDPERARQRLRAGYEPAHTVGILLDGRRVGFYALRPVAGALSLDHLYILPAYQGRGLGSVVLRHIAALADEQNLPVRLGALRDSPSNVFYQRHGYVQTGEDAWDIYYERPARA